MDTTRVMADLRVTACDRAVEAAMTVAQLADVLFERPAHVMGAKAAIFMEAAAALATMGSACAHSSRPELGEFEAERLAETIGMVASLIVATCTRSSREDAWFDALRTAVAVNVRSSMKKMEEGR